MIQNSDAKWTYQYSSTWFSVQEGHPLKGQQGPRGIAWRGPGAKLDVQGKDLKEET
jgi:hypothetical protein